MATPLESLMASYDKVRAAAAAETNAKRKAQLESMLDNLLVGINATTKGTPDFEQGEGGTDVAPQPFMPPDAKVTVPAGGTAPPDVRAFAEANAQQPERFFDAPKPGVMDVLFPKPQYNDAPPAQSLNETMATRNAAADAAKAKAGAGSVAMPPTPPAAAPEQSATGQSPELMDYAAYREAALRGARGGGAGGGMSVRSAAANAGAASAEAAAATQAQYDAITSRGAAAEAAGNERGATIASYLKQLQDEDAAHQSRIEEESRKVQERLGESLDATQDYMRTARETTLVDSMGETGNRILGALSLALGAIGQSLTKSGVNPAMEVLKMRIDADMRNRAERLRGKAEAVSMLDKLYVRQRDILGDEEQAKLATRASLLDQLKLEVERQVAVTGGQDFNASQEQVKAGLEAEYARSKEAQAVMALQASLKAARSGPKQPSELDIRRQYVKDSAAEIELQDKAADLADKTNPKASADLGSEEGKREADRKQKVAATVKNYDQVINVGEKLLSKGVPTVVTRALANGVPTIVGENAPIPMGTERNEQMNLLMTFTKVGIRATDDRISDKDLEFEAQKKLRQGLTVSQDALIAQIRNQVELAKKARAQALAADEPAAAAYEAQRKKNEADIGSTTYRTPGMH